MMSSSHEFPSFELILLNILKHEDARDHWVYSEATDRGR